ncbi:MAG: DMT family transporter [Mesorhizobium sp.]
MKYVLVALAAGAVLPVQALINSRLSAGVGGALLAGNISFFVAAFVLAAIQLGMNQPLPSIAQISSVPLWAWIGGALGAVYVVGSIQSVGAIGTTSAICLIIAGQIAAALVVDRFGLLGAVGHPLTLLRLFGACLVLAGAVIVVRG